MRRYDVLKYLKKVLLIGVVIALLFVGFMGTLSAMRRAEDGENEKRQETVMGGTAEGSAAKNSREEDEQKGKNISTAKTSDPKHIDITETLKGDSPASRRKEMAVLFIGDFKNSLQKRDREFILSKLNRNVIESSFFHLDEDAYVEGIFREYGPLTVGAELFLTGLYPIEGSEGYVASLVQAKLKSEAEDLEYDYENQQVMNFTVYFDDKGVTSYLPFPVYSIRQNTKKYGLER